MVFKEIIKQNKKGYLNFFSALLLMFFIPISPKLVPMAVVLWLLTAIADGNFKQNYLNKDKTTLLFLSIPVLFFIINALSYFYSNNKTASFLNIQTTATLFFIPLAFIFLNTSLYKKYGTLLFKFFIAGNLVSVFMYIVFAFVNSCNFNDEGMMFNPAVFSKSSGLSFFMLVNIRESFFSYVYLSKFLHPSYFALYLNTGIVFSYYLYKKASIQWKKVLYIIIILLFYTITYLLTSRAGLLALFAVLVTLSAIELKTNKHKIIVLLFSFTLLFGLYKAITFSKLTNNIEEVKQKVVENNTTLKNKDARLIIWESTLHVIKKNNILFGVGNGDMRDILQREFEQEHYQKGIKQRFDPHNQYLATILSGGIILFSILLLMLSGAFIFSIKTKRYILSIFIAVFSFNILVESMLLSLSGIVIFAFLYSFFIIFPSTTFDNKQ